GRAARAHRRAAALREGDGRRRRLEQHAPQLGVAEEPGAVRVPDPLPQDIAGARVGSRLTKRGPPLSWRAFSPAPSGVRGRVLLSRTAGMPTISQLIRNGR